MALRESSRILVMGIRAVKRSRRRQRCAFGRIIHDFTARDMCCACGGGTDAKQALDSDSVPRRARSRPVLEEPATDTGHSTGAGVGSPFNAGPGAFTSRPPLEAIVLVFETEAITRAANLGHAQSYVSQLEEDGVPFRIIGADEPYLGWGHKWHALQHVLDRIPPSTVVVVSDSRDVLLNAGSAPAAGRLVAAFEKLVAGAPPGAVVAGAEGRCCVAALTSVQPGGFFAPGGSRAARACSSGRPGCPWVRSGTRPWERFMGALAAERGAGGGEVFLNAGLVAGRAADLARLVHRMNITVEEDDQAVLSDLLYRTPDMIVLDYNQTLFGSSRYWIAMEDGGCPYVQASPTTGLEHLEYGTRPVFLHGAAHFQECLDFMAQLLRVAVLAPTRRSLQEHRWGRSDGNGEGYGRSDGNGDGYGLTSTSMGMSDSSTISSTSARTGTTLTATTTRTPRASPLWSLLLAADGATGDHLGRSVSVSSSGSLVVAGAWLDDDSGTDSGSAYVFDGYTGVQLHKLLAGDGAADGEFGRSVCVSSDGSFVAVGAPNSGSVYIFDGATGAQVHQLVADDGTDFDMFGISVSMTSDGSHVLVGAYLDDDSGTDSGSAYVFDGSTGVQLVKLLADDGADDDGFGRSVSMSSDGGLVVVGACKTDSGSAYVFNGLTGMQLFKLLADDEVNGHYFGCSVSVSSDASRVVVGAYQDDVSGSRSGSAYVFDGNSGVQMYKLLADDGAADDYFGFSVSVSSDGSRVAVGALKDDARGSVSGSAYVFDGNTGSQLHKLVADDGAAGDQFGFSVSLSSDGSRVAVGAALDDDRGYDAGSVYVCSLTTGNSTSTSTPTITSATASNAAVGTPTLTTASSSTPSTSDTTRTASSTLAEPPAVAPTSTSPSKTPDAGTTASTITTLATITTSTTFTEDPLVSTISGTMTLIVSDPTAFVGDTRIIAAVSEGIANAVRVQNHQVSVALSADRRLAVPAGRGLAAEAGPVEVSYEITAPAGPSSASGTSRSHIAAVLTADNITSVMQESRSRPAWTFTALATT
ncbi:unnamed protein product [Prorocentrum cordatum]|uniref:Uncharacterized protein n=1 Tax=Prorocentrum cordatum TaxID=2364126 RepID=A0ABN9S8E5_9DINO|nr:unnamed protein product [Polarella glacialis]